ncbi:MAG: ATP-grasp domain-containing protein, partial [Bradyrhizobium sp.]|nr:ATP-grasp domain-containing protein [Bradyrhizobium sp.]
TGASTVIRHVENQEMAETAAALTEALGCSGFVSFDFMLNTEDETATLIEMNPRCVGSCHLGQLFGQDRAGALMSEVSGRQHTLSAESADEQLIALFPKELDRDPKSFYLSSSAVRHDVPSAEPALVAAHERDLVARHPADARLIRRHISQGPVDRPSPEAQRGHYTSASHLTGEFVCNASGSSGRDR